MKSRTKTRNWHDQTHFASIWLKRLEIGMNKHILACQTKQTELCVMAECSDVVGPQDCRRAFVARNSAFLDSPTLN